MENILGVIGMLFVMYAVFRIDQAIKSSRLTVSEKGKIYVFSTGLACISMAALSYLVFFK
jgi:hypothetical protein